MSVLSVNGDPVPVAAVGGWIEDDSHPSGPVEPGVDLEPRSGATEAREWVRMVRYRSPEMDRADAEAVEAKLAEIPLTLTGDFPGVERTGVADELTLEPSIAKPAREAAVTCTFLLDPVAPE